jgi:hypothetical protein
MHVRPILAASNDMRRRLDKPLMEDMLRGGITDEPATIRPSGALGSLRTQHPRFGMRS